MRRHAVGMFALMLLLGGVAFEIWPPVASGSQQLQSACWRVGALMAVWWLAYKEVMRLPAWILAAIPALALTLAIRPRWFLIALPIVIALLVLRPRAPKRR
ncbi:MAG: hypothetical protein GXY83_00200 [Rhodopirellula sp.]|nr:hypothetical protein [Rhodopirellula sp.]